MTPLIPLKQCSYYYFCLMYIVQMIQQAVITSLSRLYDNTFTDKDFQVNQIRQDFEGDYTVVMFSLLKKTGDSPEILGNKLGNSLVEDHPELFSAYNIIKGFLNITISDQYFTALLESNHNDICFGKQPLNGKKVMVEYSSPNTNKPLHLGHLRNNFLGWSVAEILKANGYEVLKSCIVNDRGIHICKSMLAWELFANGATPEKTGIKGDHLVGDYYVMCETQIKLEASVITEEVKTGLYNSISEKDLQKLRELIVLGNSLNTGDEKEKEKKKKVEDEVREIIRSNTPIMKKAQQMLFDWEQGKPEVRSLWEKMNGWVYDGFDLTYKTIGTDFDIKYYESDTYLLGKDIVQEGISKNIFYTKDDGSVWIDLTPDGLDEKLVLRKDGTSVYITSDLGLAKQKYEQFGIDKSIYVIADEQLYHMKVLKLICQKLALPYADDIHHLSYGMVELPSGKMKSREGTVVDADELVDEMISTARQHTEELGKVKDFNTQELDELYRVLGLGAMKFYLLKVDPKKKMVFNPHESIDFHGFTGPFVQYTYARIRSILRKEGMPSEKLNEQSLLPPEKQILVILEQFPAVIIQAAKELSPSVVANYTYSLAKTFNSFYAELSVTRAESEEKKNLRLHLAVMAANVIKSGMQLMGINVPERM